MQRGIQRISAQHFFSVFLRDFSKVTPQLKHFFEKWRKEVDRCLDRLLPSEKTPPQIIHKAMRYSLFAGGKRLRPILAIAAAEICGMNGKKILPAASALELIHTYSLVHDDLPAMDDDDLRRGKPTSHKAFGEGVAILTGDALLTYAFHLIAKNAILLNSDFLLSEVIETVARGAGTFGMVGGQIVDLQMDEGRWRKQNRQKQIEILKRIHAWKTAALIRSSILTGALCAKAGKSEINQFARYGEKIGLAFQIADDILDVTGDKKLLGKKGSDRSNKKLTYPALFGLEDSRKEGRRLVEQAKNCLKIFDEKAAVLRALADYIVERTY